MRRLVVLFVVFVFTTWPQFRGANHDNIVDTHPPGSWKTNPTILWSVKTEQGHSGAAISDGRVYFMDHNLSEGKDLVRCLDLETGSELWRHSYPVLLKPKPSKWGVSRTVPAVSNGHVVTIGPMCHVTCLTIDGELVWRKDMVKEFGTKVPPWYTGQCPLIDDGKLIIAPGGDPLMMAINISSGSVLWEVPNPNDWGMTHSSIVPFGDQYVYCTTKGIIGVKDGKVIWQNNDWVVPIANVPLPVPVSGTDLFLSGGYKMGSGLLRASGSNADLVWSKKVHGKSTFNSECQTPIFWKGNIYGLMRNGKLACLDLKGNILWESKEGYAFGPYVMFENGTMLLLHCYFGTLTLLDVSPSGYTILGTTDLLIKDAAKFKLEVAMKSTMQKTKTKVQEVMAPMAVSGNKVVIRDAFNLYCVEMPW